MQVPAVGCMNAVIWTVCSNDLGLSLIEQQAFMNIHTFWKNGFGMCAALWPEWKRIFLSFPEGPHCFSPALLFLFEWRSCCCWGGELGMGREFFSLIIHCFWLLLQTLHDAFWNKKGVQKVLLDPFMHLTLCSTCFVNIVSYLNYEGKKAGLTSKWFF